LRFATHYGINKVILVLYEIIEIHEKLHAVIKEISEEK